MNVKQLIAILEVMDPDALVLMSDEDAYPHEVTVDAVEITLCRPHGTLDRVFVTPRTKNEIHSAGVDPAFRSAVRLTQEP